MSILSSRSFKGIGPLHLLIHIHTKHPHHHPFLAGFSAATFFPPACSCSSNSSFSASIFLITSAFSSSFNPSISSTKGLGQLNPKRPRCVQKLNLKRGKEFRNLTFRVFLLFQCLQLHPPPVCNLICEQRTEEAFQNR